MFFVQNNPDSFTKMIITQPICVKWVEILKWQEGSSRKTLLWDGCSLDAIRVETFPPPPAFPPSAFFSCVWLRLPHRVWEPYHWWTAHCSQPLWMTPLRAVPHFWISLFVSLPPPSPCHIQNPDCHRDLRVIFFFFSLGTLSAFIRLVWHLKTPTWHSF